MSVFLVGFLEDSVAKQFENFLCGLQSLHLAPPPPLPHTNTPYVHMAIGLHLRVLVRSHRSVSRDPLWVPGMWAKSRRKDWVPSQSRTGGKAPTSPSMTSPQARCSALSQVLMGFLKFCSFLSMVLPGGLLSLFT